MEFLASINPLIIALVAGFIGLLLGVGLMMLLDRRRAGGKSVEQLREEFDDYRGKVAGHFAETSDLFRDMTEKYRDVYNHLAAGSQALCEDPMKHARLEFTDHEEIGHADDKADEGQAAEAQSEPELLDKVI